ncbi:MAG: hypothetical protein ACODAB_08645 [Gemmatimonadota bacterium]
MKLRKIFPLLTAVALFAAACGGDDQSDLDREMDLALAEDSLAELGDTASAEEPAEQPRTEQPQAQTPRQQQPTPQPQQPRQQPQQPAPDPGPQYENFTVATGTAIDVTLDQELSTRTSQVGDLFTTTVVSDVVADNGVAIPAGSQIRGRVTAVQKSGQPGQAAVLKIAFDEVTVDGATYPVALTVAEATPTSEGRSSTGEKVGRIGIGAAAGAILGEVIGGEPIIGAAIGAAAGTAIVLGTADSDAVLAEDSPMTVTVDEPITVERQV